MNTLGPETPLSSDSPLLPRLLSLRTRRALLCLFSMILLGDGSLCQALNLGAMRATDILRVSSWGTDRGLPSNKIMDVVQTKDGFLWLATIDGLARFDGQNFVVFDEHSTEGIEDHLFTCLHEDSRGVLWIGHANGSVTRLLQGKFTTFSPPLLPSGMTRSITSDAAGDIWTYSDKGILSRLKDSFSLSPEQGVAHLLMSLARSSDGQIWLCCSGNLSVVHEGKLSPITLPTSDYFVKGICAARKGGVWIASGNYLRRYQDAQWKESVGPFDFESSPLYSLTETTDGQFVAGSSKLGLFLIPSKAGAPLQRLSRANGFPSDWVLSVCEDREGNVWAGTGGAGLVMVCEKRVTSPTPPDNWGDRAVLSVSSSKSGALWVGTEGSGLYRLNEGKWDQYSLSSGIRNPYVWSVLEDSAERLWLGTWSNGIYTRIEDGFVRASGIDTLNIPMPALAEDRSGGLWVGSSEGLLHYKEGQVTWVENGADTRLRDIRTVLQTEDGVVWFGSNGQGLGMLFKGRLTHFDKTHGLPSLFIQCLYQDKSGCLWLGTAGSGLVRYKAGRDRKSVV